MPPARAPRWKPQDLRERCLKLVWFMKMRRWAHPNHGVEIVSKSKQKTAKYDVFFRCDSYVPIS